MLKERFKSGKMAVIMDFCYFPKYSEVQGFLLSQWQDEFGSRHLPESLCTYVNLFGVGIRQQASQEHAFLQDFCSFLVSARPEVPEQSLWYFRRHPGVILTNTRIYKVTCKVKR